MNWFSAEPPEHMHTLSKSVNTWWDSIPNTETNEFVETAFGDTKVFIFGSKERGAKEFSDRHKGMKIPSDVGTAWSDGTNMEIWVPMKRTKSGNIVVNHWALGHELGHIMKWKTEKSGTTQYGHPDDVTKKDFYEKE